jgi:hypothetical protein
MNEILQSELLRVIIKLAIINSKNSGNRISDSLILKNLKDRISDISIKATIELLELNNGTDGEFPKTPIAIECLLSICDSCDSLYDRLDEGLLWLEVSNNEHASGTIRFAYLKDCLLRGEKIHWDAVPMVILGSKFLNTAEQQGFLSDQSKARSLLSSMVDILFKRQLNRTHPLRIGRGPEEPQRQRGVDKAWRMDISHEYHLHYWELPNRRFEFANIVTHNNYDISYR